MKKIININFHSRVIPIEETAYDILRKYIESLKKHFAGEEGGDEIVNDIEDRFAELFSDKLKKGNVCITDGDVEEIITSMGRPEDFDQDENAKSTNGGSTQSASFAEEATSDEGPRRLYRSENDKMVGGVCGGLAAYLRIDPSFIRILFAVLILGFGTGVLLYLIMWIALPPRSMVTKIKKRLFRDPDHRVVGGVASGLAAYFNIDVWIPRVIFSLPIITGTIASLIRHEWFNFDGLDFITGGFGGTLFITYIILWIVLPEANTASEKLEMRGEKIDLESIKNTIKSDLEGFKQKASNVGTEIKERAEQFGSEMKNRSGNVRKEFSTGPRQGIGHAIGVLFKAFFLFISVIITFALVTALIGLFFTSPGLLPVKNYFIHGFWQNIMIWCVLIFFFILPVVGLLTSLIRRIIGAKRGGNYLGYIFGSLWVIGLISLIFLVASISRQFSMRSGARENVNITAPVQGRLIVKTGDQKPYYLESDWMGMNWRHNGPFLDVNDDSLTLNTVRVNLVKSTDTGWHVHLEKLSRGNNGAEAMRLASEINFPVSQNDSILLLSPGFSITPKQQFRNQQVLVIIEVPVGKKIFMDENLDEYQWFNINVNRKWRKNGVRVDWNDWDGDAYAWSSNTEYIMTPNGLERTSKNSPAKIDDNDDRDDDDDNKSDADSTRKKDPKGEYRYHKPKTGASASNLQDPAGKAENKETEAASTWLLLTSMS